jgi:hypothetical protein
VEHNANCGLGTISEFHGRNSRIRLCATAQREQKRYFFGFLTVIFFFFEKSVFEFQRAFGSCAYDAADNCDGVDGGDKSSADIRRGTSQSLNWKVFFLVHNLLQSESFGPGTIGLPAADHCW